MTTIHLNTNNFEKTLQEKTPIIVDFWASWCGPCQMMGPVFEALSDDYKGKLHFAKLDTEESPVVAQKNSIMSIPALVIFSEGKEIGRITGAMPKDALKQKIDAILG